MSRMRIEIASMCIVIFAAVLVVAGGSKRGGVYQTCETEICNAWEFGLHCENGGVIHINKVVCTYNYDPDCNLAREGLLTLCAGQQTCAANGLRKLIRACKNKAWSNPYVRVNYSCIADDMIIRECHGDDVTEVRRRQAVILSPDYTGKNRDALYNHCSWSFHVPMWKEAVLTIHQLASRRTPTTCDQPLLQLRYPLCNGGGMKTEKFCGLLNTEEKRRVCGTVVILGRGFDHRYDAGTRFMLSFKVDNSNNLKRFQPALLKGNKCGGRPTVLPVDATTSPVTTAIQPTSLVTEKAPQVNLSAFSVQRSKDADPFVLNNKLKLVLSLVLSGVVIVILLTAVIVVCYRTKQLEKLKYGSDSTSRRRSRESSSARFDTTGSSRHGGRSGGGSSIEEDLDEDLTLNNPILSSHKETSENSLRSGMTSEGYHTNSPDKPDSLEVIDPLYAQYATVAEAVIPIVYSKAPNDPKRYSKGSKDSIDTVPNYEAIPYYNNKRDSHDSFDGDYDNVEFRNESLLRQVKADIEPRRPLLDDSVDHYVINGDHYAIVNKHKGQPKLVLVNSSSENSSKPKRNGNVYFNNFYDGALNNDNNVMGNLYQNTTKSNKNYFPANRTTTNSRNGVGHNGVNQPPYLSSIKYNNHIRYLEDDEECY